jgi:hypothetical protein
MVTRPQLDRRYMSRQNHASAPRFGGGRTTEQAAPHGNLTVSLRRPDPRAVPLYRSIIRMALWVLTFAAGMINAMTLGLGFAGRLTGGVGTVIFGNAVLIGVFIGVASLTRWEIRVERLIAAGARNANGDPLPMPAALSTSRSRRIHITLGVVIVILTLATWLT